MSVFLTVLRVSPALVDGCRFESTINMRIVSLCPSLTELVFDLGRGGDLMGITEYCTHPTDRVESVEKVGGPKNPKIERILELRPDLVLLNEEENRREDAEALTRAGVPHHVSFPKTPTEAASMVRSVGKELAREEQAEVIARDIEGRLRRVSRPRPAIRQCHGLISSGASLGWQRARTPSSVVC